MVEISNTTLAVKLGAVGDARVLLVHAPRDFELDVNPRTVRHRRPKGAVEVVVAFFIRETSYRDEVVALSRLITLSGGLWIAFPKRASGVATSMSDHVVREHALPLGLVDNKVCAVDATWTAIRLVWRREVRATLSETL